MSNKIALLLDKIHFFMEQTFFEKKSCPQLTFNFALSSPSFHLSISGHFFFRLFWKPQQIIFLSLCLFSFNCSL